jgi:hypothetical protein
MLTCCDCGEEIERAGSRGPNPERCPTCKVERRRSAQRLDIAPRIFRVLSLGAGQQSSSLLLMSALGKLPKLDLAVFADTGWERQVTYDHLSRLERLAMDAGIPLRRVSVGNLRDDVLASDFVPMPVFGKWGNKRVTFRQGCTRNFKIRPIRQVIRDAAGPLAGLTVHLWLGISFEETYRLKPSPIAYIEHVYPLVDMRWTRTDCQRFLREHDFGDTPRSSCVGCPYKSIGQWREMQRDAPDEWADAVAFDEALRQRPEPMWLHSSLKPLPLAVLQPDQGDLFGEECEGYCST